MMQLRRLAAALVVVLAVYPAAPAGAAPKAELWARWTAQNETSAAAIDHGAWDQFLRRYVAVLPDGIARVGYAQVNDTDRAALAAYLAALAATPIDRYARPEQRAFWINLYNALTVQLVLDHYPIDSIQQISYGLIGRLMSQGPWDEKLVEVAGERLSLNDIEHRILRPIWRDPRLYYALNCAALGCPGLMAKAFTAADTEEMLEAGARAYVNHPRGARVDNGRLIVSSLYVWFRDDFGGTDAAVIAHLRRYAGPPLAASLADIARIDSHDFDWALNDAARAH